MICIDCSQDCVATIVQYARLYSGELRSWHICATCAREFEAKKDQAAFEWKAARDELAKALARIPHGQVTPDSVRRARRAG